MALLPMAMYGLEIPPGDVPIPARGDIPATFRITMAAIDPTDSAGEIVGGARSTLKILRQPLDDQFSDEDSEDFDVDAMEEEFGDDESSDSDDENVNGGPSEPSKSKKAKREKAQAEIKKLLEAEGMDIDGEDDDEDDDDDAEKPVVNAVGKSIKAKGKMPASDEDESDSDDDEAGEIEEFVICTLDPTKTYQQPLDLTLAEDERAWFKVTGTHTIYLTGNYVEPVTGNDRSDMYDPDSDEEEDYDLSPDEDELDDMDDESVDELDDMEDPRITELAEEDDEAPALVKKTSKKSKSEPVAANKNKRPAPESADEDEVDGGAEGLDEMIAKEAKKAEPAVNGEQKLSKKQLKKLKKNDGAAAAAPAVAEKPAEKVAEAPSSTKSDKKVSFAKELEQGPTPTKAAAAADQTADGQKPKPTLGVKTVQGVTIDDRKLGSGQVAKNGDRVSMRYIGKLQADGKVFDSNKKGKPFSFKLGTGDVIKGWEIGIQGMSAGGERRITFGPSLGYGGKKNGDIPANSTLMFDVKLLEISKK